MEAFSDNRRLGAQGQMGDAIATGRRAILGWVQDGTLAFATADDQADDSLWKERLATSYQNQFADAPQLVAAIDRAYQGQAASETVRLNGGYWDVRLWPVFQSRRLGGVVGILTDATDRITAHRTVMTLKLFASLRYRLARSDSPEQFLTSCCKAIDALGIPVWIATADEDGAKALRIITDNGPNSAWFANLNISWDVAKKNGRHPPGEAVRTGRVQIERDVRALPEGEEWIERRIPWKGLLAIPLRGHGGDFSGVLVVHSSEESDFDDEAVRLWEQIAQEIAEGVELLLTKQEHTRIALERQAAYHQYQRLFDTIFDIVIVHREGRVLEINPAGVKVLGARNSSDIIGAQIVTLIAPADRELMKDMQRDEAGAESLREFRLLSLDGRSIDVEGITVSVSHNGQPARLSHWRDISERKRVENLVVQQKTSLEYAQQVVQSGSIELECIDGKANWSRNALMILGLEPLAADRRFIDAIATVVAEADMDAIERLIADIRQYAKACSCEVRLKSADPATARTLYVHGVPQVEQHTRVPRIFVVVQDISTFRNAERTLKAKLAATWRLARVGEWTYELDKQVIVFHGDQKDFLGVESPITSITFEQFMATIRPEDQEEVGKAVTRTLRHGTDGEVVYEEQFHQGTRLLLYARWVPERAEDGRITRLRGLSMDISRVREVQQREAPRGYMSAYGIPEKQIAYSRLSDLSMRATNFGVSFTVIALKVSRYRHIKREIANADAYARTHRSIARTVFGSIANADTFARLEHGRFLLIVSGRDTPTDVQTAVRIMEDQWRSALRDADSPLTDAISVGASVVRCPEDGEDWRELLTLLEQQQESDEL